MSDIYVTETVEVPIELYKRRYIIHLESNKMAEIEMERGYLFNDKTGKVGKAETPELAFQLKRWIKCSDNVTINTDKIVKVDMIHEEIFTKYVKVQKIVEYDDKRRFFGLITVPERYVYYKEYKGPNND